MAVMKNLQPRAIDFEVMKTWPHPNYINPEERGWEAPIALTVVLAIAFFIYVARLWARVMVSKSAGIDGYVPVALCAYMTVD